MTEYTPTTADVRARFIAQTRLRTLSQVQGENEWSRWLAAHDAEVAANALRAVADTLGKDAITAAGLRMLADRKSSPELGGER